jgi:colanic acid/amylovoran biosynthesis glycosyltransferase
MRAQRKLKIAYLTDTFPAPSETFIRNQIAGIVRLGHEVEVYCRACDRCDLKVLDADTREKLTLVYYKKNFIKTPCSVAEILLILLSLMAKPCVLGRLLTGARADKNNRISSYIYMAYAFRRKSYDVIHAQYGLQGRMLAVIKKAGLLPGNPKLVVSLRGHESMYLTTEPQWFFPLFEQADVLLPVSRDLAEKVIAAGCPEERVTVHHSGLVLKDFEIADRKYRDPFALKLICIGRLVPIKGIEYLIDAVRLLSSKGIAVKLGIVGDGPLRSELESQGQKAGISEQICFTGWLNASGKNAKLRDADALVLSSIVMEGQVAEGIPNVIKEAMAMQIPVIGTNAGGVPELIDDGVNGLLVEPQSAEALADGIVRLISLQNRWPDMGRNGREKVLREYDIEALSAQLSHLYVELIKQ